MIISNAPTETERCNAYKPRDIASRKRCCRTAGPQSASDEMLNQIAGCRVPRPCLRTTPRFVARPQKGKVTVPADFAPLPTDLLAKPNPAHTKFSQCGRADRNRRSKLYAAANESGHGLRRPKGMMPSGRPTSLTRGYVRRIAYLRSFWTNQIVLRSETLHSRAA